MVPSLPYMISYDILYLPVDGDISQARCGTVKPPSPRNHQQWEFSRKHCTYDKKVICVKQQTGKHLIISMVEWEQSDKLN